MAETTLRDTVARVRTRIQLIRTRNENIGEQNTKATLIEPVLAALGWDTQELDEVCREYRCKPQDNPVDYALFIVRAPRLFVEAKPVGSGLSDRKWISQTLSYATVVGVTWCVLTNGDEYRLYNAHAPVDVEEKLFRTVRISDDSQHDDTLSTLELLSKIRLQEKLIDALWQEHFVDRRMKKLLEELLNAQDGSLVRLIRNRLTELSPSDIRESLRRLDIHISLPIISSQPKPMQIAVAEDEPQTPAQEPAARALAFYGVEVKHLIDAGLVLAPMELEAKYHGVCLTALVQSDGTISFNGEVYGTLSTAAGYARNSVIGPPKDHRKWWQTNGWVFWRYRDTETGEILAIDHLRQQYLGRKG